MRFVVLAAAFSASVAAQGLNSAQATAEILTIESEASVFISQLPTSDDSKVTDLAYLSTLATDKAAIPSAVSEIEGNSQAMATFNAFYTSFTAEFASAESELGSTSSKAAAPAMATGAVATGGFAAAAGVAAVMLL